MASENASTSGFKWVDILEKEFDKSFVAADDLVRSISDEYEVYDICETNRKLLGNMGSCFVQVIHKAQTIFQQNAKYEAELIHLREEMCQTNANFEKVEAEKKYLMCQLQSTLLESQKLRASSPGSMAGAKARKQSGEEKVCQDIQTKLANEMAVIQRVDFNGKKLEEKARLLEWQNANLRRDQVELESELVGARLDARYLDKELAGRIQQIQILLANGTSQDHKHKVWAQIEAEMHLQRSKTISNMCYSKQRVKDTARVREAHVKSDVEVESKKHSFSDPKSKIKQVAIHKNDSEELGMAILGGSEHGLPIMISEVFPDTAVGRSKNICAGDVILAVNGDSFHEIGHHDAVKYLSALRGTIVLDLENRIDDEIEDVCDMENRYFNLLMAGKETESSPVANGPLNQKAIVSHPGKARPRSQSIRSTASSTAGQPGGGDKPTKELPQVHSSPRKGHQASNGVASNGST